MVLTLISAVCEQAATYDLCMLPHMLELESSSLLPCFMQTLQAHHLYMPSHCCKMLECAHLIVTASGYKQAFGELVQAHEVLQLQHQAVITICKINTKHLAC